MTPRRRQPLFEALGESPRRDAASPPGPVVHPGSGAANGRAGPGYAPPAPRAPVVVESPHPAKSPLAGMAGNRTTVIAFLVAAVIILFMIVWSLAYKLGERQGQQSVLSHTAPQDAAVITGQDSTPSTTLPAPQKPVAGGPGKPATSVPPNPVPAGGRPAGMPPVAQDDPRIPGNNYLELCPLTWKDAEPAVRYLQANGVRATAIPHNRKVDPAKPEPNNPFLIIVDQPYPSGKFRATQAERNALVAEIRRLGKKWQSEHRGASDFSDPMWRLQKGN